MQEVYRQGTIISASLGLSILWSLVMMFVTEGKRIVLSKEESLVREVLMKECLESISKDLKSLTRQKVKATSSIDIKLQIVNVTIILMNNHIMVIVSYTVYFFNLK